MVDVREAAEKLGFEYCEKCSLIWCDKMGMLDIDCPRCSRDKEIDELSDKVCNLEDERDTLASTLEDALEKLDQIGSMF